MSRDYILNSFLRQAPRELLATYFAQKAILTGLDFNTLKETQVDPIIEALEALPGDARAGIESDFRRVFTLCNASGSRLLADMLEFYELDLADELGRMKNHHARAMWLFLNPIHAGRNLFEDCSAMAEVHSLSFTASKRLRDLPNLKPSSDPLVLAKMESGLRELYRRQGRGYHCKVEYFQRPNPTRHYFVAYPEDYSSSSLQWEDAGLRRVDRRAAFEVAYLYQPEEGILELSAPGSRKEIKLLQEVFCRLPLGLDGIPTKATDRCFVLNGLKADDHDFPTDPADGIESVQVVALRLSEIGNARRRLTVEQDPNSSETVHEYLRRVINQEQMPLELMNVTWAKLRVVWYPEAEGKKPKALTFTLGYPDSISLKDEPRHLAIKKYLKRWRLQP